MHMKAESKDRGGRHNAETWTARSGALPSKSAITAHNAIKVVSHEEQPTRRVNFESLPLEIVSLVATVVEAGDQGSLKAFRSLNKTCAFASTRLLFSHITILLREESIMRLNSIFESPAISNAVSHVSIDTAEYTDRCLDNYDWDDRDFKLRTQFEIALLGLKCLPNLRSVEFRFSKECVGPRSRRHWWEKTVPESIAFRNGLLENLFEGLHDHSGRSTKLQSLSIENLQDWCDKTDSNRTKVLSRITKLALQITAEIDGEAPEKNIERSEVHDFFATQLLRHWLSPVIQNLTQLKLYSADIQWGYLPRCDLPTFPKLKSLALGKFTFAHSKDLTWLLSHAATLEELSLDDCPIIVASYCRGRLDAAGYPLEPRYLLTATDEPVIRNYGPRWHNYFDAFRTQLPHLTKFRSGFGDWHISQAFRNTGDLGAGLWAQRYRIFDTCLFIRPPFPGGDYDGLWANPEHYPDCTDEDLRALVRLREAILLRRGEEGDEQFLQLRDAVQ